MCNPILQMLPRWIPAIKQLGCFHLIFVRLIQRLEGQRFGRWSLPAHISNKDTKWIKAQFSQYFLYYIFLIACTKVPLSAVFVSATHATPKHQLVWLEKKTNKQKQQHGYDFISFVPSLFLNSFWFLSKPDNLPEVQLFWQRKKICKVLHLKQRSDQIRSEFLQVDFEVRRGRLC